MEETLYLICGTQMVVMGKEDYRSLKVIIPQYLGHVDVYYAYACKTCEQKTDENIAGAVSASVQHFFCGGDCVSQDVEYVMYSPLCRLEQALERAGTCWSRQAMSK